MHCIFQQRPLGSWAGTVGHIPADQIGLSSTMLLSARVSMSVCVHYAFVGSVWLCQCVHLWAQYAYNTGRSCFQWNAQAFWQRQHLTSCPQGWVIKKCGGRMVTPARGLLAGMETYTHLFSSLSEVLTQDGCMWWVGAAKYCKGDDAWWVDRIGKRNGRGGRKEHFPPLSLLLSVSGNHLYFTCLPKESFLKYLLWVLVILNECKEANIFAEKFAWHCIQNCL